MRTPNRRSGVAWILLTCAVLMFLVLARPIPAGKVHTLDDLAGIQLPYRHHLAEALSGGDGLLWSPLLYNGFDLHAEGEAGMAHPLHLTLYGLLPLSLAFNLELLANYLFLFFGTRHLFKRLQLTEEAALLGALSFTFGGFCMLNYMHLNHVAGVAHIPWLLAAHDRVLHAGRGRLGRAFAGVALVTGSQLLVAHPQYVIYSWIAEVAFVLLRLRSTKPSRLALCAGAKILGVGIGAVQLLPTLAWIPFSDRAVSEPGFGVSGSLHPVNLLQFFSPFGLSQRVFGESPWEFGAYLAGAGPALLAWLWLRRRRIERWRSLVVPIALFSGLMLVLAMGKYGGIGALLFQLPGPDRFRAPTRHLLLFQLGVAALMAIGFVDLSAFARRRDRLPLKRLGPVVLMMLLTLIVWAGLLWTGREGHPWSSHVAAAGPLTVGSGLVMTPLVLVAAVARGLRGAVVGLVVVACVDVVLWGAWFPLRWDRPQTVDQIAASVPAPPEPHPTTVYVPAENGRTANLLSMRGHRSPSGFTGLAPVRRVPPDTVAAQRVAGVRWTYDVLSRRYSPVAEPLAPARLVARVLRSELPERDLQRIDVTTTALVERRVEIEDGPPGDARITAEGNGWIDVAVDASTRQLLVLTESFHRGWSATVDGREIQPLRVNGDWLGCVVAAGSTAVRLRYRPASFRTGLGVTLLGLVATAGVALGLRRGAGRTRAPSNRIHDRSTSC